MCIPALTHGVRNINRSLDHTWFSRSAKIIFVIKSQCYLHAMNVLTVWHHLTGLSSIVNADLLRSVHGIHVCHVSKEADEAGF